MRDARPLQYPILLDRNENPYGPSDKVFAALRDALPLSNRYSRAEHDLLIRRIAALHAVNPEQIALGCGSSEMLRLAAMEFLGPEKRLVQAAPTCPLLGNFARSVGAEVVDVSVTKACGHDLDAMLVHVGDSAGLVYICNPNSPTGTLTPTKDIEKFVRKLPAKTMVLVDEAYHHFVGPSRNYTSFLDQPVDPRVMVSRTFSKIYGLAGMRVGYVVASPEIACRLSAITSNSLHTISPLPGLSKQPRAFAARGSEISHADQLRLGIGTMSATAAVAALDDSDYVHLCTQRNSDGRQEFMNQVNARFLGAFESRTNFVMLNPMRPPDQLVEHLKNHNIFIGPLIPQMPKYVRVSLGTPAEMSQFWRVLDLMPGVKMVM